MAKYIHGGDIYRHKNIIDFSSNSNPYGPPESVIYAIKNAADDIPAYPDTECSELRRALSMDLGIPGDMLFFGNGTAEVIYAVVSALRPKKALVQAPTFAEYERALDTVCCETEHYMTFPDDDYGIREDIIDRLNEGIDMFFLCNPNNPTGTVTEKDLLLRIADRCNENDITMVVDECFLDFSTKHETLTMIGELQDNAKLMVLRSFTKLYAMAGVRLGYCVSADCELIDKMTDTVQPWNVSLPAQYAGIAALREKTFVETSLKKIEEEKQRLYDALRREGLDALRSEGNYLFFTGDATLYDQMMEKGIMLRDCSNYNGLYKGCYRAAVKRREDNMRLIDALKSVKGAKA